MNKKNIVYDKALDFSVRVVNLYNFLDQKGAAAVMSKQLLRCGTSIGTNISESISAESNRTWTLFINWPLHRKKRKKPFIGWFF